MKKKILLILIVLLTTYYLLPTNASAASSYVLPYPSTMPGTIWYKVHLVEEKLLQYWYFGNFGQFEYNLKESDKYLVEAKILFEYNQYLLAVNALEKSDQYFQQTKPFLIKAKNEGKNISDKEATLQSAAQRHTEVLTQLIGETPEFFNWTPEKSASTQLKMHTLLEKSIQIRQQYNNTITQQ